MTVETPQPRDRVRWQRTRAIEGVVEEITSDGLNIRAEDGRLHLCQVEDATVEVLERADNPTIGEIRAVAPSADGTPKTAVKVGSRLSTNPGERCMWVIVETGEMLADGNVSGLGNVIGAVPDSPAAKVQSPARRSVRVPNEPHGPSPTVRILMANRIAEGRAVEAVGIAHDAGMDWHAARVYVESMSEYQTYLSEHGRTEVDPAEADRMRAMGFDKQPEFQVSDEDRALIQSVLDERTTEYVYEQGDGSWKLDGAGLSGVVADIVWAAIKRDRERGGR